MPHASATIGDFSVLPLSIPPLPSFPKPVVHHIYVRRNAPKIATPNDSRSLFVTNLPVDSTQLHLRSLVTSLVGAGRFENAELEGNAQQLQPSDAEPAQAARLAAHTKKRKRPDDDGERAREEDASRLPETWSRSLGKSGGTAVILLADDKSVELVLKAIAKLAKSKKYPVWGDKVGDRVPPLGQQWLKAHNRLSYPDKAAVQESIDAFFTVYDRKEQEAAELAKRLRNEPDEDGFVTVTRGGRNAPARQDEAEEARRKMADKEAKKKEELDNFYRFQLRDRKKAEQADLVRRFDEDRKKVAAMREKRAKFRPET
ncbi:hypothetical protein GQ53DRAFT_18728 [Thozetella sp. PMI_491]|nr:hypothetical protein GQ53DRAFT_18728 [Thozetella sp. PMI_491]